MLKRAGGPKAVFLYPPIRKSEVGSYGNAAFLLIGVKMKNKLQTVQTPSGEKAVSEFPLIDENLLKSRIYTIRGVKVMLDADLAEIYGYSTKRFNEQVKNNIEKFDEDFRFQLTSDEVITCSRSKKTALKQENLRSKKSASSWGGLRYAPYAFTEQGIYMLMTVLKGERAIAQSKALIRLFKQMKDYIVAENHQLIGTAGIPEMALQMAQNTRDIAEHSVNISELSGEVHNVQDRLGRIDLNLQKVMENFIDPSTYKHFLILNGRKLEADVAYTQIYGMAKKSLTIVDNYVDVKTLNLLRNAPKGITVLIFSDLLGGSRMTDDMLADFRAARPDVSIDVKPALHKFHDRYIFVDFKEKGEKLYHCGASSKDAGNKITTIVQLEDIEGYRPMFEELWAQVEK